MNVVINRSVKSVIKRLPPAQRRELDGVIQELMKDPEAGELKRGDLVGVRVYKFRINRQLMLLVYIYEESSATLQLVMLGSHENFYRDLKKN